MPESTWNGPKYSLKEMMNFHGKYNYTDRRVLRKNIKTVDKIIKMLKTS